MSVHCVARQCCYGDTSYRCRPEFGKSPSPGDPESGFADVRDVIVTIGYPTALAAKASGIPTVVAYGAGRAKAVLTSGPKFLFRAAEISY